MAESRRKLIAREAMLRTLIENSGGKIVGIDFVKKDDSDRTMSFRLGVKKGVKGSRSDATKKANVTLLGNGMMRVFDMNKGFRVINLRTTKRLAIDGVELFTA